MTKQWKSRLGFLAFLLLIALPTARIFAQSSSQGTLTIIVRDKTGGVVPEVKLTLQDQKTNDLRQGVVLPSGTFSFLALNTGTYKLTVSKPGYKDLVYDAIVIHAAQVTDLAAALEVGSVNEQVVVAAEQTPLLETTSNAIGSNIDVKQIEDLPLNGRDASAFTAYVAGASNGIFNGERGASQTVTVDGAVAQSSRFKDDGNSSPANTERIENIDEMVVQTDQIDLNQGFGQADSLVGFVTRRGGAQYHGRVYADLQNSGLNAFGYWADYAIAQGEATPAQVRKQQSSHFLEWGPSIGGPIPIPHYKDKLFFFFSYTHKTVPGSAQYSAVLMTPSMQAGNYTYTGTDNASHTVNLFTLAAQQGQATSNSTIAAELANINTAAATGIITASGYDPANIENLAFGYPTNYSNNWPTFRVDYNATPNLRFNLAYNQTKYNNPNAGVPPYPGKAFQADASTATVNNYTTTLGVEWTIRPTLLNQFRIGYLYDYTGTSIPNTGTQYLTQDLVIWDAPEGVTGSGVQHAGAISNFYPLFSLQDNVTWQRGKHSITLGGSGYREQDHYWNNPLGWAYQVMGMAGGDPALNAFQDSTMPASNLNLQQTAQAFYATLVGRLSGVYQLHSYNKAQNAYTAGAVNLDEVQQAYGLFAQDSWRIKPSLTINYGIRWDFTGDDYDKQGLYFTLGKEALWGPSGYNNTFHPGSFQATNSDPSFIANQHAYNPWHVSPQPALGVAWNPRFSDGLLSKLAGDGKTVIRAGYALRNYTEAYQNFYSYAQGGGLGTSNVTQAYAAQTAGGSQPAGTYAPGAYLYDGTPLTGGVPASVFQTNISQFQSSYTESSQTFLGQQFWGMDQNIKQPYIQSWNLGIQREVAKNNVIEARYVGNHGVHEWIALNPNEVNVFENGFLQEFKQAQQNMQSNPNCSSTNTNATGPCSFAGTGMPIMTTAFGGDPTQWENQQFITELQNGQVGDFANTLAGGLGGTAYFCNLAGNFSGPCGTNAGITGGGNGPYPSNLFQANPYAAGQTVGYLTSAGSSNYHSLQLEFRQKNYHGASFTANYTIAKNLGVRPVKGGDSSNFLPVTMRNLRLASNPSDTDVRHTFNLLGTYDLPFGKGKFILGNSNHLVSEIVGNWTLGTITTFHSGLPFLLTGGNHTFNDYTDGGINLTGISLPTLRKSVGVYPGQNGNINFINPKYISANYLTPNTTPGTLGLRPWLWGPHAFNTDLSLSKVFPIHDSLKFSMQGEFLNAFNHMSWTTGLGASSTSFVTQNATNVAAIQNGFGSSAGVSGARVIELRANIEF